MDPMQRVINVLLGRGDSSSEDEEQEALLQDYRDQELEEDEDQEPEEEG